MRQFRVPQFRLTTAAVMMVVLGLAATVSQADTAKSQVVKHWQKFKPGSSATMAATIASGAFSVQMQKKETLVEVTSDTVTIELAVSTTMGGQQRSNPPTKQTFSASSIQDQGTEVGHEKIEAAGKTFDCTVVEGKPTTASPGGTPVGAKGKLWMCDEVPGGVVQIQLNASGHDIVYKVTAFEVK